jgi:hypothetical protein
MKKTNLEYQFTALCKNLDKQTKLLHTAKNAKELKKLEKQVLKFQVLLNLFIVEVVKIETPTKQ